MYVENHELISVSGLNLGRRQHSIDDLRVMTQRSAKVVTAYRGKCQKVGLTDQRLCGDCAGVTFC
ncbi:hypothetical protein AK973_3018 [Pseudomonas brassicacearum]|nr:hypothetical protein AK973_3018 [Pseudomonas brassicacearum]